MGASSGIAGADLLGTMVQRHPADLPAAPAAWERKMRPFIHTEQDSALLMRKIFTPHDRREHLTRGAMLRIMHAPVLGPAMRKIMKGPDMSNKELDVAAA
ncbi:hypothetical protein AB0I81_01075 [Nonomuraea sp. NPDC050404]|uniref:hypothetical protein n=1 Tax=Nonomuraea sp. NPDC050404 TaxID=3155783 RepID=UPI0034074C30